MQRQRRKLTVEDRVAIELRRKDGVRAIARELGRSPSVISAELGREPDGNYAAGPAQAAAAVRWDRSGRRAKLAARCLPRLLRLQPEQIAGQRLEEGTEVSSGLRVRRSTRQSTPCHAVSCGASCSPARASRIVVGERRGRICDIIRERPAEVEDARTLGRRSDQGQPLLGRHAGPAASWSSWPKPRRHAMVSLAGGAGAAAPHPDL